MAADTREDTISRSTESSKSTISPSNGTVQEPAAVPAAPPNANALPGGAGLNTAGGRTKQAGYFDALRSIKFRDFEEVHTKPCVRDALLTGIGGGFGIGGVRAVLGGMLISPSCQARRLFIQLLFGKPVTGRLGRSYSGRS